MARERGLLFMVDAAQTAGAAHIDMERMHIDFLCMPGHKGLYGPAGTGMLITKHGESLSTIIEGGTGSRSSDFEQPADMPDRLESGTLNLSGIPGLKAGMDFVLSKSIKVIESYEMGIMKRAYQRLSGIRNVKLYTPAPCAESQVALLSFNVGDMSSEDVAAILARRGIAVRAGLHCAPMAHHAMGTLRQGTVRCSVSVFTKAAEVDALCEIIEETAKNQE